MRVMVQGPDPNFNPVLSEKWVIGACARDGVFGMFKCFRANIIHFYFTILFQVFFSLFLTPTYSPYSCHGKQGNP